MPARARPASSPVPARPTDPVQPPGPVQPPASAEPESDQQPLWSSPRALWQAPFAEVVEATAGRQLSGAWKLLLLGDGSPTRHLQLLTGRPVEVELIAMAPEPAGQTGAPAEVAELQEPLLRRQVWLNCGPQTLGWAESWWNQQEAEPTCATAGSRSGATSPAVGRSYSGRWTASARCRPTGWRSASAQPVRSGAATTASSARGANSP